MPCPNVSFVGEADLEPPSSTGFGVLLLLARSAFAFAMSAIQLGWLLRAAVGLGESGFVIELSSQLDFVGLQRFDGLDGGEVCASAAARFSVDNTDLLRLCGSAGFTKTSLSSRACVTVKIVKLLLLELGREDGSLLPSLLLDIGSSLGMLYEPVSPPCPLRELAAEFCLFIFGPGCALHRLLTLSERFIIAL